MGERAVPSHAGQGSKRESLVETGFFLFSSFPPFPFNALDRPQEEKCCGINICSPRAAGSGPVCVLMCPGFDLHVLGLHCPEWPQLGPGQCPPLTNGCLWGEQRKGQLTQQCWERTPKESCLALVQLLLARGISVTTHSAHPKVEGLHGTHRGP